MLFELFKVFGVEGVVIVNNVIGNDVVIIDGYFVDFVMDVILGSNLNVEFLGWIEGVIYFREIKNIDDLVFFILLNDIVFSYYFLYFFFILYYL